MNAKITLKESEIEQIILEHLLKKFKVVNSVKLNVGEEWRGHGPTESKVIVFKGAECEVEIE